MSVLCQEDPSSAKSVIREIPGLFYKFECGRMSVVYVIVFNKMPYPHLFYNCNLINQHKINSHSANTVFMYQTDETFPKC